MAPPKATKVHFTSGVIKIGGIGSLFMFEPMLGCEHGIFWAAGGIVGGP